MDQVQRLENFAGSYPYNTSTDAHSIGHRYRQKDEHALARLGKKQVLEVRC